MWPRDINALIGGLKKSNQHKYSEGNSASHWLSVGLNILRKCVRFQGHAPRSVAALGPS